MGAMNRCFKCGGEWASEWKRLFAGELSGEGPKKTLDFDSLFEREKGPSQRKRQ